MNEFVIIVIGFCTILIGLFQYLRQVIESNSTTSKAKDGELLTVARENITLKYERDYARTVARKWRKKWQLERKINEGLRANLKKQRIAEIDRTNKPPFTE